MNRMQLESAAISRWKTLRTRANDKQLPFDLTVTDVRKLLSRKTCHYTGTPFSNKPQEFLTLDKIVPKRGYVKGNVVPCTERVNKCKSDLTVKEITRMAKVLRGVA